MPQLTPPTWTPPTDKSLWPDDLPTTGDQIADFIANSLASAKSMCISLNNNQIIYYYGRMNANNASLDAGRPAPYDTKVPYEWLPTENNDGSWAYEQTTFYVCNAIPLDPDLTPKPKVPNTIHVGKSIGGNWFSVGDGDTMPNGFTTPPGITSADGVSGTFTKYGAPVGPGWYLKVG